MERIKRSKIYAALLCVFAEPENGEGYKLLMNKPPYPG